MFYKKFGSSAENLVFKITDGEGFKSTFWNSKQPQNNLGVLSPNIISFSVWKVTEERKVTMKHTDINKLFNK